MKTHHIEATALIHAPAERVYAILADYHDGHGRIAPKPWFGPIEVEQGGTGAGTIIRFTMTVLGKTQACRSIISEPAAAVAIHDDGRNAAGLHAYTLRGKQWGRFRMVITYADGTTWHATETFKCRAIPSNFVLVGSK